MNKNVIVALAIGLIIGVGGTLGINALTKSDDTQQTNSTAQTVADHSTMSMADMNKELENLSGDDYDKAFIEMMIAHHQGAIDMAKLSPERAKHQEIKDLSLAIISAQEKEISEMQQWQVDWGYTANETSEMMHGSH
ncbi:MAG TPA: DUF305 domain-containing protein [Candidatus Saccharimonadales bacterium]|nr:DUF305 domain-containing protein [Candidatus Saccharimonadales bacterium]